jgi:hypothetical protein
MLQNPLRPAERDLDGVELIRFKKQLLDAVLQGVDSVLIGAARIAAPPQWAGPPLRRGPSLCGSLTVPHSR